MANQARNPILLGLLAGALAFSFSSSAFAVDAGAAKLLARKNSCLRCHHVSKKKEGPSYQAVAYKYKDKANAADELVKHITSGLKVKLSDGHEEEHKVAKYKDMDQVKNLVEWILAQ
ncbi:MAG: class I cytochrome c [Sulfuricella sp.]|nr:class I cytochrome c [Sulfuricella sp.]